MALIAGAVHWVDILIFFIVLLISLGIGVFFSIIDRKKQTTSDYLMAGRKLGMLPTFVSTHMSNMSALIMLMITSDTYMRGSPYIWYLLGNSLANVLVVIYIVPLIYRLRLTSINEYLERRYKSKSLRCVGAVFGLTQQTLYMAVAILAPSTALSQVIGVPLWILIILNCVIGTIYTSIGGMKAVVWSDVFQGAIMYLGLFIILIQGCVKIGGFGVAWEVAKDNGRLAWDRFNLDATEMYTAWSFTLYGIAEWLQYYGFVQATVQRYSAVTTERNARWTVLLNIPATSLLFTLLTLIGIVIYSSYVLVGCGPYESGQVSSPNQILPQYVLHELAIPGLTGAFCASLFSGCLSTLSSGLSGLCAMTWEDLLKNNDRFAKLPEAKKAFVNKVIVLCFGILSGFLAMGASAIPGTISQVAVLLLGSSGAVCLGMFILGVLVRKADWKAATCAVTFGTAFMVFMVGGSLTVKRELQFLSPVPTSGCSAYNISIANISASPAVLEFSKPSRTPSVIYNITGNQEFNKTTMVERYTGLKRLFATSQEWYYPLGFFVTFVVGIIATLIISNISGCQEEKEDTSDEPRVSIPLDTIFCCLRQPKCASRDEYYSSTLPVNDGSDTPLKLLDHSSKEHARENSV